MANKKAEAPNIRRTFRLTDEYYFIKLQAVADYHRGKTKGDKTAAVRMLIDKEYKEINKNLITKNYVLQIVVTRYIIESWNGGQPPNKK
jgi:hypothetical protein